MDASFIQGRRAPYLAAWPPKALPEAFASLLYAHVLGRKPGTLTVLKS